MYGIIIRSEPLPRPSPRLAWRGTYSAARDFVTIENLGRDKSFLQWLLTVNGAAMLVGGGFVMAFAKKIPLKPY